MSIYHPLSAFLATCTGHQVDVSFGQLEQILGFHLCHSAVTHKAWWSNGTSVPSPQNSSWLSAGWRVKQVDLQSKLVTFTRTGTGSHTPTNPPAAPDDSLPHTQEWCWEGNVQRKVAAFLRASGWAVRFKANTAAKQHGIDILASKAHTTLAVEVKGCPSATYASGPKKGTPKSTGQNNLQANHYFTDVLFEVIKRKTQHPILHIAIGLPDLKVYRSAVNATQWALTSLGISVYWVTEHGQVLYAPNTPEAVT